MLYSQLKGSTFTPLIKARKEPDSVVLGIRHLKHVGLDSNVTDGKHKNKHPPTPVPCAIFVPGHSAIFILSTTTEKLHNVMIAFGFLWSIYIFSDTSSRMYCTRAYFVTRHRYIIKPTAMTGVHIHSLHIIWWYIFFIHHELHYYCYSLSSWCCILLHQTMYICLTHVCTKVEWNVWAMTKFCNKSRCYSAWILV